MEITVTEIRAMAAAPKRQFPSGFAAEVPCRI